MPSSQTLTEFIDLVERNEHVQAIERFYAPDATMQENEKPPKVGRDKLVESERAASRRMFDVRSTCIRPAFVNGDHVVLRWVFEWRRADGTPARLDEISYQRWKGEQVVEEKFFYDPAQLQRP